MLILLLLCHLSGPGPTYNWDIEGRVRWGYEDSIDHVFKYPSPNTKNRSIFDRPPGAGWNPNNDSFYLHWQSEGELHNTTRRALSYFTRGSFGNSVWRRLHAHLQALEREPGIKIMLWRGLLFLITKKCTDPADLWIPYEPGWGYFEWEVFIQPITEFFTPTWGWRSL